MSDRTNHDPDDEDWQELDDDGIEELMRECGKTSRSGRPFRCTLAGTEHCDFVCPFRWP